MRRELKVRQELSITMHRLSEESHEERIESFVLGSPELLLKMNESHEERIESF